MLLNHQVYGHLLEQPQKTQTEHEEDMKGFASLKQDGRKEKGGREREAGREKERKKKETKPGSGCANECIISHLLHKGVEGKEINSENVCLLKINPGLD